MKFTSKPLGENAHSGIICRMTWLTLGVATNTKYYYSVFGGDGTLVDVQVGGDVTVAG